MGAWDDLDSELGFKPKPTARVSTPPQATATASTPPSKTAGAWDDLDAELSKPVPPRPASGFGAFADDAIGAVKSIPGALSEAATNVGDKVTSAVVGAATKIAYPLIGIDRAQADSVAVNLDSATDKLDISKPSKPVDQDGLRKWADEYDVTRRAIRDRFPVESRLGATDDQIDKLAADIVTGKQKPAQKQEISEITPGSKVYKSSPNTTLNDVATNVGPMLKAASGKAAVGLIAAGAKKENNEPMFDQAMRAYNMADDEVKTIGMQFGDETANARIFGAATSVAQNILPMMAAAITKNAAYAITPLTLQVAGDRTGEMLNKGYSANDAIAHGVMFGLSEGVPERLSLGMFFKVLGPQKGAKQAAIALAEAYGTEIATENVTELTQFIIEKFSDKPELTLADLGKRLKETTIQTAISAPVLIGGGIAAHKVGEAMQRGSAENRADDARQSAMSKLNTLQPKPSSTQPTGVWDDLDAELAGATPQPLPNNTAPALPQATIDAPAAQVPGQAVPEAPLPIAVVEGARNTNSVVDSETPVGVTQAATDAIQATELLDDTPAAPTQYDFNTNFPQPTEAARRELVAGDQYADPSDAEQVKSHHEELISEMLGLQNVIDVTGEAIKTGIDPRTGKKPRTEKAAEALAKELAADQSGAIDRIDSYFGQYANIYGQDAAEQLRTYAQKLYEQDAPAITPETAQPEQTLAAKQPATQVQNGAPAPLTQEQQNAQEIQSSANPQSTEAPTQTVLTPKPTAKKSKPTPKARELTSEEFGQVARKRFLKSIKQAGGVTLAEAKDITGEAGGRANRLLPGLFANSGKGLDLIAEHLHERGYLSNEEYTDVDGGVQRVRELIRTALDKQMVGTVAEHDEFARLERAERVAEDAKLASIEEYTNKVTSQDDFDMGGTPMSEADALELFGFNEGKINDTIAAGKNQGDAAGSVAEGQAGRDFGGTVPQENAEGARGDGSQGRSENRQGTGSEGQAEGLTSYTNSDIIDREAKAERAQKEADKAPPSKSVTADQVDLFNPQDSLFTSNREEPEAAKVDNQVDNKPAEVVKPEAEEKDESPYGDRFTIDLGEFFGKIPYRASAPATVPEGGKAVSSEIIVRKTAVRKSDQETYDLPAKINAWRVSAIRNKEGEIYSQVEAMTADYGRTPDGEVVGYFTPLRGHALDAVARIAPSINNASILAFEQAIKSETDIFSRPAQVNETAPSLTKPEAKAKNEPAPQLQKNRDHFTLERLNRDTKKMEPVTFSRGDSIKVAGSFPMRTGEITGISHAERRFKVNEIDVWYDFGYAYKSTYDESAYRRENAELAINLLESRLDEGNGVEANELLRDILKQTKGLNLTQFDDDISRIRNKIVVVERAEEEKRGQESEQRKSEYQKKQELERSQAKPPETIRMTMAEWKAVHKDFKGKSADGTRQVMRDGGMRNVEIVKPSTIQEPQSEVEKTKAALDAAGVTGTDRLTTIAAVNRGEITAEDVAEAHAINKLDAHDKLFERVREGDVRAEEFKAAFESVLNGKEQITAELDKVTKAALFKQFPSLLYRYKNENKAEVISAVYRSMVDDFTLGQSYSYGMSSGSRIDSIRAIVDGVTDESLAEYAAGLKKATEERAAEREIMMAGIENPEVLEDFGRLMRVKMQENEGMTFGEARMTLTPEQRAKFDDLAADKTRADRANRKEAQKDSFIRAPGETVATTEIIKTKHTKHGHDLWQFAMEQRVSPDEFKSLVAQARRLGGDYSSYRGNGAIPGWQFRTEEAAKAFKSLVAGDATAAKEVAQTRRDAYVDDRSQTAVERLTEMADALEEKAGASLNQERKVNTSKRAGQAASAEASANGDKALAKTMRNIAQAIDAGKAKLLDRVRQKVQVETLQGFVRTAQGDMLRKLYPDYSQQEKHKQEPITPEVADYATFPTYTAFRSDLASLGRTLLEVDGTKKLGQRIMKVADDVSATYLKFAKDNIDKVSTFTVNGGARAVFPSKQSAEDAIARSGYKGKAIVLPFKRSENVIILSPSEAMKRGIWQGDNDKRITLDPDLGAELVEKIGKAARRGNRISVPWVFENAYDSRKRLTGMGIETPAELRAALREFIGLREVAEAPSKVKQLERAMVGRKNDGFDFFPTPASVADEMIEAADIEEDMSVLEPSAGMGHIAERLRESGVEPDVVEIAIDRRELLEAKGFNLVGSDFMDINPREFFTYGDTFRDKDGTEGVMRGLGGMGSNRVRLVVNGDERTAHYTNRDDLTGVRKNGYDSGYDRIIMNPPFSDGRAAQHVQHAYELLKPGGRLVALMDEGVFFRSDKKAQSFRDWMEQVGATDEKLPEGSFLDPSLPVNTGVNARMVVIEKPTTGDTASLSLARGENFDPLSIRIAEATVARIGTVFSKKGWNVDLSLAATFDALPDEVKAAVAEYGEDTKVKGVVHKGVAYVVADEHGSESDLETTILHEVTGHVGVRRLYGKDITGKLGDLYLAIGGRKGLSKIAAERGLTADLTEYAKMLGESEFSDEMRTRIMLEEVLAHIAQAPKFSDRVKSVIGAIRAWLRANGFAKLAEYGETDLLHIVSQGRAALATVETDAGPAVLIVTAKFSRSQSTRQQYEQRIDELFSGEPANRVGALVLDRSDVLDMLGMGDKPIMVAEHKVIASRTNHGLTAEHWKKIPEWLDHPGAVFDSDTQPGRLVFIAPVTVNGAPIRIIVEPNAKVENIDVHLLVNAYDAKGVNPIHRWFDDGLMRYFDKTNSRQFLATSGLQLPRVLQGLIGYGHKVFSERDLVKYRAGKDQDSTFSRTEATDTGMNLRDLDAHIANLTRGYKNLPPIINLQSVADAPQDIQEAIDQGNARNDVEGMYVNGKIYLFADHLNADRAEHVLLNHELEHYGLRGLFGSALDPVLHDIWASNLKVQARAAEFKKKFGIKDNVTATEEVLADMPESELVKLKGWQKLVFAVRDWLRGHGFTALADAIDKGLNKKLGQEAKADMEVARIVRAARAYAKDGKATRNPLGGVRFGKDATWRDVVSAWKAIGSDMAAFQNPTPDSFDMAGAAREIDPGMRVFEDKPDLDEQRDMKLAYKWLVKMPDETAAYVLENESGEVWLDASRLEEGMSGGTKLYLLVGSYAEANGKLFIGDPAGLSDVALLRRTENMLSLALRFGRTGFMMPHEYQMNPEAKLDTVLKDVARPIEWVVGDDENNLAELLKTSYANTVNLYPDIKNVTFNFDEQRFEQDGREFTDFSGMSRRGNGAIRQRGLAKILSSRKSGAVGGEAKDQSPIGSATLKRAAITNTVSRAARGGAGRDVLAGIIGLVSGGLNSTPLRKILYSRQGQLPVSTNQPPTPPTRQTPFGLQGGSSSNTPTWDAPISTGLDDIAYKLQNKNIDLKRVIQSIKEAGRAIQDKFDPYLQEELFHKRAAKRTEDFVERELNPLLLDAKLRDLTLDEIDEYLHARHAEEANKLAADRNPGVQSLQDGGSGMKTADAKAYLAGLTAGKRKSLDAIAAKVDAIISTTRNLYASYGLESANAVQEWDNMFDHYVPLMREDNDGGMGVGQGFSIRGREVKHRTGSTAAVVDILANIAMQREKVVVRGEKNRVAVALVGLAKLNPNSEFWEVGRIPTEQVLNEKTGVVETRPDPMFKSRENAIVAKISDGKGGVQEIAVLFNERNDRATRMAASLKNLDAAQLEGVLGVSAKITRYFASINTQYNPVFGVVNLIRDYQGAALNLAGTPLAKHKAAVMNPLTVMSALKGIYLDTRAERKGGMALSQWAQLWEEFNLEGGTTGYRDLFRTSADRANAIEHTLDPTKWMDSDLGKLFTAGGALKVPMAYAQKKAEWLFDWLSDYNLAMENAVRLSAYKAATEQGLSNQRAASLAKNLTVNFNRKGQLGQQAGALYAFFNASMQGTARIAETVLTMDKGDIKTLRLSKPGAVIVGGGVMLGVMQALMLAAAGFDDDEPPEFVRERSLVIPIGDKKYVAIPMPLGYHVLPNLGRIPTELILRGGRDAGEHALNLIGTIIEAFNPTGSAGMSWQTVAPTPLDPFVALTENRDWTGKPIARQSFNKATPGHALGKDTATHPGRWIAEAINYVTGGDKYTRGVFSPTPDQIDYLGAQLGGGVLRELGKLNQSVSSAFTGEELPPHKIPLAGRFYGDAEGAASHGAKFYKNVEHLNDLEAQIKGREQDGIPLDKYEAEHPEAELIAYANSAEREVSALRKGKRALIEEGASRDEVKEIEAQITTIMKELNEQVSEVRR